MASFLMNVFEVGLGILENMDKIKNIRTSAEIYWLLVERCRRYHVGIICHHVQTWCDIKRNLNIGGTALDLNDWWLVDSFLSMKKIQR